MTRPTIKIHNVATDEVIEREMNDEEFAQWEIDVAEAQKAETNAQAQAAARQALLDKLGITEDEAKLLLGGN